MASPSGPLHSLLRGLARLFVATFRLAIGVWSLASFYVVLWGLDSGASESGFRPLQGPEALSTIGSILD